MDFNRQAETITRSIQRLLSDRQRLLDKLRDDGLQDPEPVEESSLKDRLVKDLNPLKDESKALEHRIAKERLKIELRAREFDSAKADIDKEIAILVR